MTIAYRPTRLTHNPDEVRAVYLKGGWKALERTFGNSNNVMQQLLVLIGGQAAKDERAKVQPCGRRAGGRRDVQS